MKIVECKKIIKTYVNGEIETPVLRGIDFSVEKGEFVSIMGRSGAGKSTLLYQLGLLDAPTSGEIVIDGKDVSSLSNKERTEFRLNELGFVLQDYALVPELTAVENVALPLIMQGKSNSEAFKKSEELLEKMGFKQQLDHLPSQLSGGEQQRVSIARAIIHNPVIIFADEPTANLDTENAQIVIDIFKDLNKNHGQTIIMVTHEEEYGKQTDRITWLKNGVFEREERFKKVI